MTTGYLVVNIAAFAIVAIWLLITHDDNTIT